MSDVATRLDTIDLVPETSCISERIVVAPCAGRFSSLPEDAFAAEGEWVEQGTVLGQIDSGGERSPVVSPFRGWVQGMLVLENQPVKRGEALFWIWGC
jgi:biotin carboxyl carrier protein